MLYSQMHEWVKLEKDTAIVGISDYAQSQLGDIVFIELPAIGQTVKKSGQLGTVESTKAASEIYTPLSGEIVAVNRNLDHSPQLVNESPLEQGWLVKIKISDKEELSSLMEESAYRDFVAREAH